MLIITSVPYDQKTWVLGIQGDVDLSNVSELQEAMDELFAKGTYRITMVHQAADDNHLVLRIK